MAYSAVVTQSALEVKAHVTFRIHRLLTSLCYMLPVRSCDQNLIKTLISKIMESINGLSHGMPEISLWSDVMLM